MKAIRSYIYDLCAHEYLYYMMISNVDMDKLNLLYIMPIKPFNKVAQRAMFTPRY